MICSYDRPYSYNDDYYHSINNCYSHHTPSTKLSKLQRVTSKTSSPSVPHTPLPYTLPLSLSQSPETSPDSPTRHHVQKGVCKTPDIVDRVPDHLEIQRTARDEDNDGVGAPRTEDDQADQSSSDDDDEVVGGVDLPVFACQDLSDDEAVDDDVEGDGGEEEDDEAGELEGEMQRGVRGEVAVVVVESRVGQVGY